MSEAPARPLRVLHLITTLDRGGAENALLHLVRSMPPDEVRSSVAYLKGAGELATEFEAAGAPVHALGTTALGQVGSYGRARRLVREKRPDVVHTHLFKADCLGAALCGSREGRDGPRLVSTKHNEDMYLAGDGPKPRALRAVARRVAVRADALVAITSAVRAFFRRTLGDVAESMRVIRYAMPDLHPGDAGGFRRELGLPYSLPIAVCPARFVAQKDHRTLLDAFARVEGDCRLVLLGRGPLEAEIRAQAASDPRVIVHGFVDDPRHAISAAQVVVLASRHEGLGRVLLEALALETPVVATRVGGIPEVVEHDVSGLLVPPARPDMLAAALSQVLFDAGLHSRLVMGTQGAAEVMDQERAMEYESLYREILERAP